MFIVLIGPPGAGKGTQARLVAENKKIPHISSGDLFRTNIKNQTELGNLAKMYMERGELVPDEITIRMLEDRLAQEDCRNGALLDGFPRTPAQADALSEILQKSDHDVDYVPLINVPDQALIERLSGRWTCSINPLHIYNLSSNPPAKPGICDYDGGELCQRDDDKPETVKNRIVIYHTQTQPLIDYYRNKGVLLEINGDQPIEKVGKELLEALSNRNG